MRVRETPDPVFFDRQHLASSWLRFAAWHKFNRYNRIPAHRLPCWEIALMESGRLDLLLDRRRVSLNAGHYLVIPARTQIASASGADAGLVYWIALDTRWPEAAPPPKRWRQPWRTLQATLRRHALAPRLTPTSLRQATERLLTVLAAARPPLTTEAAAMAVAAALLEALDQPAAPEPSAASLVQPALDQIAAHVEERLELRALARLCRMSLTTFHAEFKRATGVPPRHYINQRKIARARELLAGTQAPGAVAAIAARLGFSSPAYFAVVFRKFAGATPGAWVGRGQEK